MKRILMFASLIIVVTCLVVALDQNGLLVNEKGTIKKVRADWYAIVPDSDPGTRYAPDNLAVSFRKDGLRVVFSGKVGEIEAGSRRWGTPLELTEIELLQE